MNFRVTLRATQENAVAVHLVRMDDHHLVAGLSPIIADGNDFGSADDVLEVLAISGIVTLYRPNDRVSALADTVERDVCWIVFGVLGCDLD